MSEIGPAIPTVIAQGLVAGHTDASHCFNVTVHAVDVAKLELDARLAQLIAVEEEEECRHDGDDKPGDMLAKLKYQGPFQHSTTKSDTWTYLMLSLAQNVGRDQDEHDEREGQMYDLALLGMADMP
ncbi:MAG: hypothetical protein FRX49_07929 [Trebouxia sp. A1-2]|nr:MAG: hypothetical protein FRX49_07929 [Trebouxia sp. A1-2]